MNKIDEAWQALKLPPEEQERAAEFILDFVAQSDSDIQLSDEQVADIEARMRDRDAPTMTMEEVRAEMRKLTG